LGPSTTPRLYRYSEPGFYNTNGAWDVENYGVPPDIEVEDDLAAP
jgi:C-terminal processing protease CtpA/Prc